MLNFKLIDSEQAKAVSEPGDEFTTKLLFVVLESGEVLWAPRKAYPGHVEWFNELVENRAYQDGKPNQAKRWLQTLTRGYVFAYALTAYVGEGFTHPVNHRHVLAAIAGCKALSIDIKEVYFVVASGSSYLWPSMKSCDVEMYTRYALRCISDQKPVTCCNTNEDWAVVQNAVANGGWTYTRLGSMCARYWHPRLRRRSGDGDQANNFFTSEHSFLAFLRDPTYHPDFYLAADEPVSAKPVEKVEE